MTFLALSPSRPLALVSSSLVPTTSPAIDPVREYLDLGAASLFVIAAGVLFAAAWSARQARTIHLTHDRAAAWIVAATAMVAFASVKTVNAFFVIQDIFRDEARADGFYERRRMFQVMATLGAGFVAVIVGAMLKDHVHTFRRNWLVTCCILLIGVTGLIRLISLHQVDELFADLPAIRYGLEPLFAVIITIAAWRRRGAYRARLADGQVADTAGAVG